MIKEELFLIGVLAEKAKVNIQTIRFYERKKLLLPKVRKDSKKVRYYNHESLDTLCFIRNSQDLGFQLEEIRELLRFKSPASDECANVKEMASKKLTQVREKLHNLQAIEKKLVSLISECEFNTKAHECPFITSVKAPTHCCK